MALIRADAVAGSISAALDSSATTMESDGLADLPAVSGSDFARLTLYRRNLAGRVTAKEIVHVTAHTAGATTATVLRAQEGTSARTWVVGDRWDHAITAAELADLVTQAAADAAIAASAAEQVSLSAWAREPLDIWDGFDTVNLLEPNSWNANTYADWIAGIDANHADEIAAGTVIRTDHGASSDATKNLYSYRAGKATGLTVVLVGGQHGEEMIAQHAVMRWFEQFVKSDHAVMRYLRDRIRVVSMPTANPYGYRAYTGSANAPGRMNANGVDLNRNWPYFWSHYTPEDPTLNAKGSAALSEPESAAIKGIVDDRSAVCVLDCHNFGPTPDEFQVVMPSPWTASRRDLPVLTRRSWLSAYGNAAGLPLSFPRPNEGAPFLGSWIGWYTGIVGRRIEAAGATLEAPFDLLGSSGGSARHRTTREAMQVYCGYITSYLLNWLGQGFAERRPVPVTWWAHRATPDPATGITAGGTLLNASPGDIAFDAKTHHPVTTHDYLDVTMPFHGELYIEFDGYIESGGTATRVDIVPVYEGVTVSAGFLSLITSAVSGQRTPFAGAVRVPVACDAIKPRRIKLQFQRTGSDTAKVLRARMKVTAVPGGALDTDADAVPKV